MFAVDRDALLCDMAETYHVYDLRALPVETLAALSFGLRPNSRIKQKLLGHKYMPPEMVMAIVADRLAMIQYQLFHGENDPKPALLYETLFPVAEEHYGFASGEEFLKAWNGE